MSAIRVSIAALEGLVGPVTAVSGEVRSAAASSTSCLDTGHAGLSAALGEFDARWSQLGNELATSVQALGSALASAARAYVLTDGTVIPAGQTATDPSAALQVMLDPGLAP